MVNQGRKTKLQSLDNIKENVRKILIEYPETRDDDNLLIWHYWGKFSANKEFREVIKDYVLYNYKPAVKNLTSPESITRCRRKFHENKEYLGSEKVTSLRNSWEKEFRNWAKK